MDDDFFKYYFELYNRLTTKSQMALRSNCIFTVTDAVKIINSNKWENTFFSRLDDEMVVSELSSFFTQLKNNAYLPNIEGGINMQDVYEKMQSKLSVRARNILYANRLTKYESISKWISGELDNFTMFHNCGHNTSHELMEMVVQLRVAEDYSNNVKLSDTLYNKNIPSERVNNIAQREFAKSFSKLSTRTQNILKSNHIYNFYDFKNYLFASYLDILKLRNCGKKSANEIVTMSKYLKDYLYNLVDDDDYSEDSEEQIEPFYAYINFSKEEKEFIYNFQKEKKHLPWFYIFNIYFNITDNRFDKIYAQIWGMPNTSPKSLDEIAIQTSHTKERIRQISEQVITRPSKHLRDLLNLCDWSCYSFNDKPYLSHYFNFSIANEYSEICNDELNGNKGAFFAILQLSGKFVLFLDTTTDDLYRYLHNETNVPYAIDNSFHDFKFEQAFKEVKRLSKIRRTEVISVPILNYFVLNEKYWRGDHPHNINMIAMVSLLEEMFDQISGEFMVKDGQLILAANRVDYANIIYDILKSSGKFIHVCEIFEKIKDNNPTEKNLTQKEVLYILGKDDKFIPMGKSSYWGLKEWNSYTGSIREIAIHITKKSKQPIHINKLAKLVMKIRPDSNEKSVVSVIRQAVYNKELSLFYGDYLGVYAKDYGDQYIPMPQSFDDWFYAFYLFVINNERLPYCSASGYEGYLYRWYYKAKQFTCLSSEEILRIDALEKEIEFIPHNATEYNFLQNCIIYRKFVEQNNRTITMRDNKELFNWFVSNSKRYNSYSDNRKKYYSDLLECLAKILY